MKEMRLAGISSIEAANAFLPAFMADYNRRFAKTPPSERDLHRPMGGIDWLDDILFWRKQRHIPRQLVVNYRPMADLNCAGKACHCPIPRSTSCSGSAMPRSSSNKRLGEVLA